MNRQIKVQKSSCVNRLQKFARLLEAKNSVKTEKKPKRDLHDGTTEQQAANKKKKKVHGIKTDIYYVKGTE
jgi:hypothetical protein